MSAPPPAEETRSGPRDLTAPSEAGRPETRGFGIASEEERFSTASAAQSDVLQRLRTVPIAHETPTSASFNRSFEVTVAIEATGDDTAADALPGEGNIVEGEAQVLDKAQATLSGSAFEIDLISPSVQTVSPVTENVRRRKVRPTRPGMHELRLELFALAGAHARPTRTFTARGRANGPRLRPAIAAAAAAMTSAFAPWPTQNCCPTPTARCSTPMG